MPLKGEYEPSNTQFVRDQVELYESSGGTEEGFAAVRAVAADYGHLRLG
jgi:hypothetical protein